MPSVYTVKLGDSLSIIAKKFYGNHGLSSLSQIGDRLAAYNGIRDSNLIKVGEILDIPPFYELFREADQNSPIPIPNGLNGICEVFGDPNDFIGVDDSSCRNWEAEMITYVDLSFEVPLSWDMEKVVRRIKVHKLLANIFIDVFSDINNNGGAALVQSYGGAYECRRKRIGRSKFSTHTWGIAIDLNTLTNPMGTDGNQPKKLVDIFRRHGFKWGGDWYGIYCDPMHFQYCTGY
jgi:hypothetical protein